MTFAVAWRDQTELLNSLDPSMLLDVDSDASFDRWCQILHALPTELVAVLDKIGNRVVDVRRELGV
jgi:hypothetical protein